MSTFSVARNLVVFVLAAGVAAYLVLAATSVSESPMKILGLGSRSQPATHAMPAKRDPNTPRYSTSGYDITPLTQARIDELAKKLTPDEAKVILAKGTE